MREILTLHKEIGNYIPETDSRVDVDVLEYSHTIIKNIIGAGNPELFIKAIVLMSKKSFGEVLGMETIDRLDLFVSCVYSNQLWILNPLLRNIGYGTSKR